MPRTHIYKGQPGHVGRFGLLNVGDHVDLHLDEELSLIGNPDFEPLSEQTLPEKIVPLKARFIHDLRRIDWAGAQIASELRTLSRHTLVNILVAMNELGIEVDAFDSMPTDDVVDNIRRAARAHGWDMLTPAERLECPAASDEDTGEEGGQEDDDDEPNGEDDKEPQGEKASEGGDKEPSADNEEDAEEDEGDEDDKEPPSEEATAAPAGPARKRAAAKNAAKPSKP
ncbi:hypothetical protein UFOVP783_62 [uncultured Caudovirales phage]|uniref:Uncharacterized protein n=1 Tax=uncultured Caudovirales phage TaxID=2100421 RepID=A0A6J5NRY8_9CAUD|nr:hypothetical protein UFOVP783_62 [uncultured Caudovirales phage]